MGKQIFITGITGDSPYDIYLCQVDGTDCIYIDTISSTTYNFIVPSPYDTAVNFTVKVVDINGCSILM